MTYRKTTFITEKVSYYYLFIPFGLKNHGSMVLVSYILHRSKLLEKIMETYIDDTLKELKKALAVWTLGKVLM